MLRFVMMSEIRTNSKVGYRAPLQILGDIVNLCIDPEASIEAGSIINIAWSPDGKRHTEIGAAVIKTGAIIDELAIIEDKATVGKNCRVGFRARLGRGSILGNNSDINTGAHIGAETFVRPGVSVGNFAYIGDDCEITSHLGDNSVVHSGLVAGELAHHGLAKLRRTAAS